MKHFVPDRYGSRTEGQKCENANTPKKDRDDLHITLNLKPAPENQFRQVN